MTDTARQIDVARRNVEKAGFQPGMQIAWASSQAEATTSSSTSTSLEREQAEDRADIVAARSGDRAAFGRLYARYLPMVHGLLLARVPRVEAEDLVQEVFMQALRKLSTLREPRAFGGWLATIARNRAHDYFRRSRSSEDLPDEIPAAKDSADTEALAALAAIRRLPEAYRETLILRLVEGMSGPEIATRTGLTPGSVRVNLHRGMAQLREILGKE
jgi:RNA polymerase sigma-70 factor, ECF subfamily